MKNGGDVTDVIHLVNISGTPPARIDRDRLDVFRLDQPTSIQRRVCRTGLSNGSVERVCRTGLSNGSVERVCRTGLSNGSVERVCEAHP